MRKKPYFLFSVKLCQAYMIRYYIRYIFNDSLTDLDVLRAGVAGTEVEEGKEDCPWNHCLCEDRLCSVVCVV